MFDDDDTVFEGPVQGKDVLGADAAAELVKAQRRRLHAVLRTTLFRGDRPPTRREARSKFASLVAHGASADTVTSESRSARDLVQAVVDAAQAVAAGDGTGDGTEAAAACDVSASSVAELVTAVLGVSGMERVTGRSFVEVAMGPEQPTNSGLAGMAGMATIKTFLMGSFFKGAKLLRGGLNAKPVEGNVGADAGAGADTDGGEMVGGVAVSSRVRDTAAAARRSSPDEGEEEGTVDRDAILAMFHELDADGSGALDRDEFAICAQRLGFGTLGPAELDLFMVLFDTDGDGLVDAEEFMAFLAPSPDAAEHENVRPAEDESNLIKKFLLMTVFQVTEAGWRKQLDRAVVRAAFVAADKDCSGGLEASEFAQVVESLHFRACTPYELQLLVSVFDQDGDGEINLKEFEEFFFSDKERVWRAFGVPDGGADGGGGGRSGRAATKAAAGAVLTKYRVLEIVRTAGSHDELRVAMLAHYAKYDKAMVHKVDDALLKFYLTKL